MRDSQGLPISTAPGDQGSPSVAFDGNNYFVVWHDYRNGTASDIYGARVDTSGGVVDTVGFPISRGPSFSTLPTLAFGDSCYLVTWEDTRIDPSRDIYGARVTPDALVLDSTGVVVCDAASYQTLPRVAFDGVNFTLDWVDWRNGVSDIYCARVAQAGVLLDTAGIPICLAPDYQGDPGIAFGDSNYRPCGTTTEAADTPRFMPRGSIPPVTFWTPQASWSPRLVSGTRTHRVQRSWATAMSLPGNRTANR